MVSRLHAKTNQIGKILNNLEKYNHLMKDGEGIRSPTTPSGISKTIFNKTSPTISKGCPSAENVANVRSVVDRQRSFDERQSKASNDHLKQSRSSNEMSVNNSTNEKVTKE